MPLIAALLRRRAQQPQALALATPAERVSVAELVAQAERIAGWLAARTDRPDARVALFLPNGLGFVAAFIAATSGRYCAAPCDPTWPAPVRAAALAALRPDVILDAAGLTQALAHAPAPLTVGPDAAPFLIGFTSGSTQAPKAFIRARRSWRLSLTASAQAFDLTAGERVLAPGPLIHGLTLYATAEALAGDAAALLLERWSAEACAALAPQATRFAATPTPLSDLVERLERADATLPQLKAVVSAGAKLAPDLRARLRRRAPAVRVLEYYGASELGFVTLAPDDAPADAVGRAFPGVDLAIRDPDPAGVGTVWVRSPYVCDGYVDPPADAAGLKTDAAGWATVGDRGALDVAGWLRLAGRDSGMILCGGLNLWPQAIEAALLSLPGLREAVALGLPDARLGQVPAAVVVGDAPSSVVALYAALADRLPHAHRPRRLFVAETLPHTASGKPALAEIAARLAVGAYSERPHG